MTHQDPDDARPHLAAAGVETILAGVGECVYDWSIADDRLVWSRGAEALLDVDPARIATGRDYAALLDPANPTSRHDAIFDTAAKDKGGGVAYSVQYALLPEGRPSQRRLWVEDVGRWRAGPDGAPAQASGVVRVVNERYEREQRLAFLSRYDELTGYFNRAHLLTTLGDALQHARRFRASIGFMVLAIDNFSAINEAYGFDVADEIFAAAARRIRSQLRSGDSIGRYSGKKLGLILMNCDEADMAAAAERFHAAIRNEVIATEAGAVSVTLSAGGVTLPRFGQTVAEATVRAEEALQEARLRGAGRFVGFTPSPDRQKERHDNAALSADLVAALNQRRLRLAFQPVFDAATRKIAFSEGLARLDRADGGVLLAADFIPLASRLGLVRLIDHRALELAVARLVAEPAIALSVNIAPGTVADSEWIAHLSAALSGRPGVAERLIVEVPGGASITDLDEAQRSVALVHDLGCRVALDRFGASSSCLRALRELGVDMVKIDGSFVSRIRDSEADRIFVRSLLDLAAGVGAAVVAPWVENEETAAFLAENGATFLQGDYLSPPVLEAPAAARAAS